MINLVTKTKKYVTTDSDFKVNISNMVNRFFRTHILSAFIACSMFSSVVVAQEATKTNKHYEKPTLVNLANALVKLRGVDISKPDILNEYARIAECDIYSKWSANEFEWLEIQKAIKSKINFYIADFSQTFYSTGTVKLDKYDFTINAFRLDQKGAEGSLRFSSVELFSLSGKKDKLGQQASTEVCGKPLTYFPSTFTVIVDPAVVLEPLQMPHEAARALLTRLGANGNENREVYVQFNITLNNVRKSAGASSQQVFEGVVDSVEFFEDKEYTQRFYIFRPSAVSAENPYDYLTVPQKTR
ncbi:MAG: DUF4852 domain-containing protein [Alphaproteobacteria bacterium]